MKLLLTVLFLSISLSSSAQTTCKCRDTSAWVALDTISNIPGPSGWIVDVWEPIRDTSPHNLPSFTVAMKQKRYGKTSGFIQERTRLCDFYIKPQEKSEFEKLTDSLSK